MARSIPARHEWLRRVSDYHSGGVSDAERREVEAHLLTCADCREALAMYQRFYALLRSPLRLDGALLGLNIVTDGPGGPSSAHDDSALRIRPLITAEPPSTSSPPPRRSRRTIRLFEAIAAILVIALLGGALFAVLKGRAGPSIHPHPTPTLTHIPANLPSAGTVVATIPGLGSIALGDTVTIAATDTGIWVHNTDAGTLVRIDPHTNTAVATIPVGTGEGGGVTVGFGSVWVANPNGDSVMRIDPQSNRVVATLRFIGGGSEPLTVSPEAVWQGSGISGPVRRIDPATNKEVADVPIVTPTSISYGAGSVWVCDNNSATKGLVRVNPQTNQIQTTIDVSAGVGVNCASVVALDGAVWVLSSINGQPDTAMLERIDPATNEVVATIAMPKVTVAQFGADAQGVWVYDYLGNLYRVDPQTNQVVGKLALPQTPAGMAVGAGSVWIADQASGSLWRITPAP